MRKYFGGLFLSLKIISNVFFATCSLKSVKIFDEFDEFHYFKIEIQT